MAGPKWSDMKKVTDKDLRRKQKEREKLAALAKEKKEKESFRNKVILSIIVFFLLVGMVVAYFFVSSQKKAEAKRKELTQLKIGAIKGNVQYKEKIGVWESLEKSFLLKGDSLKCKKGGNVEIYFEKNRIGRLLEKSILTIKDVVPHADNSGADVTAYLKLGSMVFKTLGTSGILKISTKFADLKLNPGSGGIFKIQILKKGKMRVVRVAVSVGKVLVNFHGEPTKKVKDRQEILVFEDGKVKGPTTISPGNEAWF